jgi:pimeloyl-ACP methyl ester carboxylesterase
MVSALSEALVLLPGLKADQRVWQPQIDVLSLLAPVIVPMTALDADSIVAMASRTLALAPPRFALAGSSMGGYVALEVMRQAPERVSRLALVSTSARPEDPSVTGLRQAMLARARETGIGAATLAGLDRDFYDAHRRDPKLPRLMSDMAEVVGLPTVERQMRAVIARPDSRGGLAAISCPTCIVVGEHDQVAPLECSRELAAGIQGSVLHVIAACGHCANLETPDEVTRILRDWLLA